MNLGELESFIDEGVALQTIYCIDYSDMAGEYKFFNSSEERSNHLLTYSAGEHGVVFDLDVPAEIASEYFTVEYLVYHVIIRKLYKLDLRYCRKVDVERVVDGKYMQPSDRYVVEEIMFC